MLIDKTTGCKVEIRQYITEGMNPLVKVFSEQNSLRLNPWGERCPSEYTTYLSELEEVRGTQPEVRKTIVGKIQQMLREGASVEELYTELSDMESEEERMIVDAWMAGNREGWDQSSDWPDDAVRYFQRTYLGYKMWVLNVKPITGGAEEYFDQGWGRNFDEAVRDFVKSRNGQSKIRLLTREDFSSDMEWENRPGNYGLHDLILVP